MADNYLEKKMEALGHGATVYRKDNPSLDTLIRKMIAQKSPSGEKVKQAQLDAAARSAAMLGIPLQTEASEREQTLRLICRSQEELGEAILASRLKAAELGLITEVETKKAEASATAILKFSK